MARKNSNRSSESNLKSRKLIDFESGMILLLFSNESNKKKILTNVLYDSYNTNCAVLAEWNLCNVNIYKFLMVNP